MGGYETKCSAILSPVMFAES